MCSHVSRFTMMLKFVMICAVLCLINFPIQINSLNLQSIPLLQSRNYLQPIKTRTSSNAQIKSSKSNSITEFKMSYQPFWEDDLPNLFGINPIEGALIFGVLYYLYGPDELYGYAREAGKAFGTYAPIAKDLAVNIFNEFKEYVDEDRQRDDMQKRGLDISKIPRRTTNVIERISESISMFSEMASTSTTSGMSEEIQSGLRPEIFTDSVGSFSTVSAMSSDQRDRETVTTSGGTVDVLERAKQRQTKKKILQSKNIDVDKIIAEESKFTGDSEALTQAELNKSLNLVQDRLELLTAARQKEIADKGLFGESSPVTRMTPNAGSIKGVGSMGGTSSVMEPGLGWTPSFANSPMTGDFNADGEFVPFDSGVPMEQTVSAQIAPAEVNRFQQQLSGQWNQQVLQQESSLPVEQTASDTSTVSNNSGMSRFQQQLSGQWNQQVLEQEQTLPSPTNIPAYVFPSDLQQQQDDGEDIFDEYGFPLPPSPAFMSGYNSDFVQGASLPDLDSPSSPQSVRLGDSTQLMQPVVTVTSPNASSAGVTAEVLLAELDRDYAQLRQRLLTAIVSLEQQKQVTQQESIPVPVPPSQVQVDMVKELSSSESDSTLNTPRESYWPPRKSYRV